MWDSGRGQGGVAVGRPLAGKFGNAYGYEPEPGPGGFATTCAACGAPAVAADPAYASNSYCSDACQQFAFSASQNGRMPAW